MEQTKVQSNTNNIITKHGVITATKTSIFFGRIHSRLQVVTETALKLRTNISNFATTQYFLIHFNHNQSLSPTPTDSEVVHQFPQDICILEQTLSTKLRFFSEMKTINF